MHVREILKIKCVWESLDDTYGKVQMYSFKIFLMMLATLFFTFIPILDEVSSSLFSLNLILMTFTENQIGIPRTFSF